MSFYDRAEGTAQRMIADKGRPGIIRKRVVGSGDPWDPSSQTYIDHPCKWVEMDYAQSDRDGSLVQAEDKLMLISTEGLAVAPASEDSLIEAGNEYAIVVARPLRPGPKVILYEAQVRR